MYGELGEDNLFGGEGDDILIGDVGYALRRYSNVTPISMTRGSSDNQTVWHKDIVLEEHGNITMTTRISQKVNVSSQGLNAEAIAAASLLFVATAYDIQGKKANSSTEWPTDLFTYHLEKAFDDYLSGGAGNDILIGQRGNDKLSTGKFGSTHMGKQRICSILDIMANHMFECVPPGPGSDIAIGDAGRNLINPTMDMPRIFQVYRSFESPPGSGYAPDSTPFGYLFTSDFDLSPNPHQLTDSSGLSLIDELITRDDVSKSNVVRNLLGISSIKTDKSYCLQPMFRVIPGFVSETHMLHGNDAIESGQGDDIIIGDDIRGYSAIDLTQLSEVQNSRQTLDNLVVDLSVRLSTLGYDTEFYANYTDQSVKAIENELNVGCDSINTTEDSNAFIAGDTLTIVGRTFLGTAFDEPSTQIPQVLERIRDVQQTLFDLHYALYEVHLDLLRRTLDDLPTDYKVSQTPLHKLNLADDIITSKGSDIIIGDSGTLYYQIDTATPAGFEFDDLSNSETGNLKSVLSNIMNQRQDELVAHVEGDLAPSTTLTNSEKSSLAFADVPYYMSVGNDFVDLFGTNALAVGDYAAFGVVYCDEQINTVTPLRKYADSVKILRKNTSVQSSSPSLSSLLGSGDLFFHARYGSTVVKEVEPQLHGDKFIGRSSEQVILGDLLTAAMVGFGNTDGPDSTTSYVYDKTINFYDTFLNAEYAQFFDPDHITVPPGGGTPIWSGQVSQDVVNGTVAKSKPDALVEAQARRFFDTHAIAKQSISDLYVYSIPYEVETDVSRRNVCSRDQSGQPLFMKESSYIPSHTQSIYVPPNGGEVDDTKRSTVAKGQPNESPDLTSQSLSKAPTKSPDVGSTPVCSNDADIPCSVDADCSICLNGKNDGLQPCPNNGCKGGGSCDDTPTCLSRRRKRKLKTAISPPSPSSLRELRKGRSKHLRGLNEG